jgi:diacylglycerol kinase (ATP)
MKKFYKKNSNLNHIIKATQYSIQGLILTYKNELAFRQEIFCFIFLFPLLFFIGNTWEEKIILFISLMLVLIAELFNSAIETVVDRISFEKHELSKQAKDIGSAGVFLTLIIFFTVWVSIFYKNFY